MLISGTQRVKRHGVARIDIGRVSGGSPGPVVPGIRTGRGQLSGSGVPVPSGASSKTTPITGRPLRARQCAHRAAVGACAEQPSSALAAVPGRAEQSALPPVVPQGRTDLDPKAFLNIVHVDFPIPDKNDVASIVNGADFGTGSAAASREKGRGGYKSSVVNNRAQPWEN